MKTVLVALIALSPSLAALAVPKDCNELKAEIENELTANGVTAYSLDIVPADRKVERGLVIGTCGNGTKKIMYMKHDG